MGGRGSSSKMSGSGTIRAFQKAKDLARRLTKAILEQNFNLHFNIERR